jgi:hypothetical protein
MATYKHLRSSTANKRPTTGIADGQLAINTNTASPGLFFKDSAGTGIVKVGPVHVGTTAPNATPAAGGSTGNYTGEQWLDTSVSPAQMKVWNGSAWVGVVADELPVSKLQDGAARQLLQTDAAGTGVEWTSNVDVPGTLDVTSTATFDSIARHPLGSAAAPTLTFTGDPNTGIYSPGADQVAVATNGSGRLFVDANGNVGIANSSPTNARLLVGDDLGAITTAARMVQVGHPSGGMLILGKDNTDYSYLTHEASTQTSNWFYRGGAGITLNSAGLVGVGTSSPSYKLHVVTDAISGRQDPTNISRTSGNLIRFTNPQFSTDASMGLLLRVFPDADSRQGAGIIANGGTNNGSTTLDLFYTDTAGTSKSGLRISDTGAVGIGVTSPGATLDVNGNIRISSAVGLEIASSSNSTITYKSGGSSTAYYTYLDASRNYIWQDNATERMRIDGSGRVGIGTSAPGQLLDVAGVARFGVNATKLTTYSDSTYAGFFNGSSLVSNESIYMGGGNTFFYNNGSPSVTIDSTGRVGIGTTSPGSAFEVKPSASSATLGIQAGTINTDSIRIQAAGTANTYLEYRGYLGHAWFVDATERARIDSSGRLLVGTSSSTGSLSNTAPVIAGLFQSFDDVATFTTGVAQTLFVIPNTNATYIVTLRRGSVGDAANYEAVSILSTNSGGSVSAVLTDLKTAANVLISISGTNLQGTQSSGGSASLRWVVTRVG